MLLPWSTPYDSNTSSGPLYTRRRQGPEALQTHRQLQAPLSAAAGRRRRLMDRIRLMRHLPRLLSASSAFFAFSRVSRSEWPIQAEANRKTSFSLIGFLFCKIVNPSSGQRSTRALIPDYKLCTNTSSLGLRTFYFHWKEI